ncbi:hypothetical protein [Streptomyces sp. NBC_01565]|uniref:hypothetical protein n=1 Tax=unclassified Streptomyces TaxID=2593676 RepID=UPI002255DD2E|nr:hypothetical protein [Streptomyces sp. NBC_01565]MCX4540029.1 hypothetical protein [Streptomyces sp. NBC_01565]
MHERLLNAVEVGCERLDEELHAGWTAIDRLGRHLADRELTTAAAGPFLTKDVTHAVPNQGRTDGARLSGVLSLVVPGRLRE